MQDLANADCIVIQGSNMAECHPVGFQWVMEAKARGAKIIHIDPRFTRTSAVSDHYVPLRAGSDIAFLGGIVNYILENEKYFDEYVLAYTNAANVIDASAVPMQGLLADLDACSAKFKTDFIASDAGWRWGLCGMGWTLFNTVVQPNGGGVYKWNQCRVDCCVQAHAAHYSPASSRHPGGVNVLFADGSVKFIKDTINMRTWMALGTRNGGEVISSDAY